MSEQQQPKEYIINDKELHEYFQLAEEAYSYKYAADKRDEIRSRPRPAPESENQKLSKKIRKGVHDARIAEQARKDEREKVMREKVMDALFKNRVKQGGRANIR